MKSGQITLMLLVIGVFLFSGSLNSEGLAKETNKGQVKQVVFTWTVLDSKTQKSTERKMTLELSGQGKVLKIDGKQFNPKGYCGSHCYDACGTDNSYDPCYGWCLFCCLKGGCKAILEKLDEAQKEVKRLKSKAGQSSR